MSNECCEQLLVYQTHENWGKNIIIIIEKNQQAVSKTIMMKLFLNRPESIFFLIKKQQLLSLQQQRII